VTAPVAAAISYELTLYVSGASALSARAVANARLLCDNHLNGPYLLSVVDVQEDPGALVGTSVIAVPTLVMSRPMPARRVVGDLSQTARVLLALGLPVAGDTPQALG